jgi:hypothetical protein
VLVEERWPAAAQHQSQDESDQDRVVELTRDRQEVGHHVERHRQVEDYCG